MELTAKRVRQLVELAFVIEPLLDKKDCTTRYRDLDGKSLYDFVIAGINTSEVFEEYAKTLIEEKSSLMFSYYPKAVSVSNAYKSKKFNNVGLLEFMFVTVKTRSNMKTLTNIEEHYIETVKQTSKQDVIDSLDGFRVAIKTSKSKYKIESARKTYEMFSKAEDVYEEYSIALKHYKNPTSAGHQVAKQYMDGFPIIAAYVNEIDESKGLIKSLENTYDKLHLENPEIKVGILADLCASAIFLYLSFQNPNTYIIK